MDKRKVYCIYHSRDWDGVMSGALVKHKFPGAILIGWDQGDPSPIGQIQPGSLVYIADLVLKDEDMLKLADKCHLIWCDHHGTALKNPKLKFIKGNRGYSGSACMLLFEQLYSFKQFPRGIKLLSAFDLHDKSDPVRWQHEILPFQYGMRQFKLDPTLPLLVQLIDEIPIVDQLIEEGKAILRYEQIQNANYCSKFSHVLQWTVEGKTYNVLLVNRGNIGFEFYESLWHDDLYDFTMSYVSDGTNFKISLRSPKGGVNVLEIAEKMGGGGHKHAAGFYTEDMGFLD